MLTFEDAYDFESYMRATEGKMYLYYPETDKDKDVGESIAGKIRPVKVTCICFHSTPDTPTEIRVQRSDEPLAVALWLYYDEMYRTYGFYTTGR